MKMTRAKAEEKFEEYYNHKTGWTPYDYYTAKKFWLAALESCGMIEDKA
jgi:hypothetical protein